MKTLGVDPLTPCMTFKPKGLFARMNRPNRAGASFLERVLPGGCFYTVSGGPIDGPTQKLKLDRKMEILNYLMWLCSSFAYLWPPLDSSIMSEFFELLINLNNSRKG